MNPTENIITTEELLEKLWLVCLDSRPEPYIMELTSGIEKAVGHGMYLEIEDNISRIMDFYDKRGFITGFRVGTKLMAEMMK